MNTQTVLTIFFFQIFFCEISLPQNDTLVSYDVRTRKIEFVTNIHFDTTKQFENTAWNAGTLNGFSELSLIKPINVFPGSGFTDFRPAQQLFPVSHYPQRTAVKLFKYRNGILKQECSGIMVSQDLVLTASHCVYFYNDTDTIATFNDSLLAIPAFDNGKENPLFAKSVSAKYYLPKSNFDYIYSEDVALVELREPIGLKTGWIGISFFEDDSSLINKVFHKFSYPGTVDLFDSTRVYNGDTLYYNFGTLDIIGKYDFGYNINGIPGQSGSSLFYTDNLSYYYSIGVQDWSGQSLHYRFSKELYFGFKGIIEGTTNSIYVKRNYPFDYYLSNAYPNPFNPTTTIEFSISKDSFVNIEVFDVLGHKIQTLINDKRSKGSYKIMFLGKELPSGSYFVRMQAGGFVKTIKVILTK